jgi:hypothetical protein
VAQVENITMGGHSDSGDWAIEFIGLNVTAPVGPGMRNNRGDVLVIQALFNFIASVPWSGVKRPLPRMAAPKLTGSFDRQTQETIFIYQTLRQHYLLRSDGIIHPGSFAGRLIQSGGPQMTITLLNEEALEGSDEKSGEENLNLARLILDKYPQVSTALAWPSFV